MDAGIRFANNLYVRFTLNPDNGDIDVVVEFITDEGVKHIIPGSVVWDE